MLLVNDTSDPTLDPVDYSEITVALYGLAVLDTTIVRINQGYPNIGVQISQETEFEHRLQNPVVMTATAADGSFLLSKLPVGTYNLVAMKGNWGYQYKFQISLAQGDNKLYSNSDQRSKLQSAITLRPEVNMPPVLNQEFTFKNGKHYIFRQDSSILALAVFFVSYTGDGANLHIGLKRYWIRLKVISRSWHNKNLHNDMIASELGTSVLNLY